MSDASLTGRRILVVEDEFMIADDMAHELEAQGAEVLGPVPTLPRAMALVETEGLIDGAVLDINLDGEMVYPVADKLLERGVPFVFATGYEAHAIPQAYVHVPRCEKPVNVAHVAQILKNATA